MPFFLLYKLLPALMINFDSLYIFFLCLNFTFLHLCVLKFEFNNFELLLFQLSFLRLNDLNQMFCMKKQLLFP